MPAAKYGTVLVDADVILGVWPQTCPAGQNCFSPLPANQNCTQFKCNAAMVTTRMAQSNGNPLALTFAQYVGYATFDVGATAIAVFGNNGIPWDMNIVQDISASFTRPQYSFLCELFHSLCSGQGALPQAKAADQALLDCLKDRAPAGSRLGITVFTGTAVNYQNPLDATDGSLPAQINNIPQCAFISDSGPTPKCNTGTNIGAAIAAAIAQYNNNPNPISGAGKNIVIVTDGLPNSSTGCSGGNCTAQGYAQDQAAAAAALGMNISTIYYCSGGGNCQSNAQSFLAGLVKGTGIALVTPNASDITTKMAQVCATQAHRLVW
jgi:hypothetical protein